MGFVHHILSTRYCKSATIGYSFNNVIVSFKSILLLQANHQCCHFFCYFAKYRYFSKLANQRNTVIVLFAQSYGGEPGGAGGT
jgi:hypothetical protein